MDDLNLKPMKKVIKLDKKIAAICERSPNGILILDRNVKIQFANRQSCRILGYFSDSCSKLEGKKFQDLLDKSSKKEFLSKLLEKDLSEMEFHDIKLKKKGGGSISVDMFASNIDLDNSEFLIIFLRDITKWKKLLKEKAESEFALLDIFEAIEDGISLLDRDMTIIKVNSWMNRKYQNFQPLEGKKCYEVYQNRKTICPWCPTVTAMKSKKITRAIVPYPSESNPSCWLELYAYPVHGENGKVSGVVEYVKDITEQKRLQDALIKSEKKFRTFFENSAIFAYITTESGEILEVNQAASNLLGYSREELLKLNAQDIYVNPKERGHFISEIVSKGFIKDHIIHLRKKDGSILTCQDTATALKMEDGTFIYQGIIHDITEKIQKDKELKRLYAILQQTNFIIILTDKDGNIEYVNPAFEKVSGYTAAEVKGQNPRILKSGKHGGAFYENLWKTITSGKTWDGRFYNRKKDGSYYYEDTHIFPLKDDMGNITHFAAIKRDATKDVMTEEQLKQAAKLEAIGGLAGGIAHDFNNILTTIQGFAELGISKISHESPSWIELKEILSASKQASRITQQLLGFSRKQIVSPRPLHAIDIIKGMLPMLQRFIGEDIQLETYFTAENDIIIADQGQVEQCILNIVINARDAILAKQPESRDKTILIETQNVTIDEIYLKEHIGIEKGIYLLMSISDTGIGMDKETLNKIFDPFFTTKPQGKGTGLGCSTVFGIVKQNGGNIRAYSEKGIGTTIKIYWPLAEKGTQVETHIKDPTPSISLEGKETILVVEDDRSIRKFVKETFSSFGYRVYLADNGEEALRLIHKEGIIPDLLFTDVIMPKMNGKELASILTKEISHIKILFTSGYTENQITHQGFLFPNVYFLHKPYTIRELISKIRSILDGK